MTDNLGFHAHDGWYFRREEDGSVRILAPDSQATHQAVMLSADEWASIVASVSASGETGVTFAAALAYHQGIKATPRPDGQSSVKPTIGRVVHYKLTATDVVLINKTGQTSQVQHNPVNEGQVYPAMVVAVFGNGANLNLKVFLDGGGGAEYWATSRPQGDAPGMWEWPPRA